MIKFMYFRRSQVDDQLEFRWLLDRGGGGRSAYTLQVAYPRKRRPLPNGQLAPDRKTLDLRPLRPGVVDAWMEAGGSERPWRADLHGS